MKSKTAKPRCFAVFRFYLPIGFCKVDVWPSPKSQLYETAFVELFVNETLLGAKLLSPVIVKLATAAGIVGVGVESFFFEHQNH